MPRANSHGKVWNLSEKSTLDVSSHSTPGTDRVNAIHVLLREAKEQKWQPSLKTLVCVVLFHGTMTVLISTVIQVQLRDIPTCPITTFEFIQTESKKLGIVEQLCGLDSELAHIIPFSHHSKVCRVYSSFSKGGYDIFLRPKPMRPSRCSRVAPSRQTISKN